MAPPAGKGSLVGLILMKVEKVWSPYFDASSVPCATDSSWVAISSQEMVADPCPLRLCSNDHPRQCPSASDRQSCFSVVELELELSHCQSCA